MRLNKKVLLFFILCQGTYEASFAESKDSSYFKKSIVGTSPFSLFHSKFKCSSVLRLAARRKDFAIATLYKTFGTDTKCFKRISIIRKRITRKHYNRRGKTRNTTLRSVIQMHLLNGAGRRNARLAVAEYRPKLSARRFCSLARQQNSIFLHSLNRYLIPAAKLINNNSHLEWLISPELESNCSTTEGKSLLGIIQDWAINNLSSKVFYNWVWNPLKGKPIKGAFHELHGEYWPVAPCIYNFDGLDINIGGRKPLSRNISINNAKWVIKKQKKNCDFVFIWTKEMNGIDSDKFISPQFRKEYNIPLAIDLLL